MAKPNSNKDDDSSEVSSESDEDLVLEGVLAKDPNDSSSSSDEDESQSGKGNNNKNKDNKNTNKNSSINSTSNNNKRTRERPDNSNNKKTKKSESDVINVDFTFHDTEEKFFHGIKSLLDNSSTLYQTASSSSLSDAMIATVGTVVSTDSNVDDEPDVYGFASIIPSTQNQYLSDYCIKNCDADSKNIVTSKIASAGLLLHGRMVNLPMEIVHVLHEQLLLDIDYAIKNDDDDDSNVYDFATVIRMAPCQKEGNALVYRYFEDEIFASNSRTSFVADAPQSYSKEVKDHVNVIVMTKKEHRLAVKELGRMVGA